MGYIRIASFSENTGKEFKAAYESLAEQGMKGLIIDLRENPGGLVTSCVEVANLVVPKGPIVSVVERDGSKEVHESKLEESKSDIGWGHQIRSYVLDQSRVKDLRTNVETGNTGAVLDGDLDQFIEASLKNGVAAA